MTRKANDKLPVAAALGAGLGVDFESTSAGGLATGFESDTGLLVGMAGVIILSLMFWKI